MGKHKQKSRSRPELASKRKKQRMQIKSARDASGTLQIAHKMDQHIAKIAKYGADAYKLPRTRTNWVNSVSLRKTERANALSGQQHAPTILAPKRSPKFSHPCSCRRSSYSFQRRTCRSSKSRLQWPRKRNAPCLTRRWRKRRRRRLRATSAARCASPPHWKMFLVRR